MLLVLALTLSLSLSAAAPASAGPLVATALDNDEAVVKALASHYTKYEHRIPMRDGVKL